MIQYMHRKFGNRIYQLFTRRTGSRSADKQAEWFRNNGYLARVVCCGEVWDNQYAVYICPK